MADLKIEDVDGGVVFVAKVVPGASRTEVCGLLGKMIKIKVSAAAEKGKANRCLMDFMVKQLGVKKTSVSIISGKTNPVKQVEVLGISAEELLRKLDLSK